MPLTFSRRALIPCAGLAASAILGSAIVAVPSSAAQAAEGFTRRVSVEPAGFTDAQGVAWEARTGFDGGRYWNPGAFDVAGTTNDQLYRSEFWGITGWHTAVPSAGDYDVTLHLREAWFSKAGDRVFDVTAEGQPAVTGVDILKAVGARTAYTKTFRVKVTDGRLDLGFKGSADLPQVSAISVTAAGTATAAAASVTATQSGSSATLAWTADASPAKGWYVERDGSDSTGYGAWGSTVSGASRSQTFTAMVTGRTYHLSVTNLDTGQKRTVAVTIGSNPATPTPTATTAPTSPSPTTAPTSPTTAPTTAPPTTTTTPAGLTVTASAVGATATLTWTSTSTPGKGWTVGRDGTDSTGYGAWSTTVGGGTRSQTFTSLAPGRTYTLTVRNADTGATASKTVTVGSTATFTPSPVPTTTTSPAPSPVPTTPSPVPTTPAPTPTTTAPAPGGTGSATARIFGTPRSGKPWFSGAWRAAPFTPASVDAIGAWRGSPMDAVTTYSNKENPGAIADSLWNISTFNGFGGILSYNLTLVPGDRSVNLAGVARGDLDWVWKQNAQLLRANGRANSLVNIGWEMNGDWWAWSATSATASQFRAAFNRVAAVMKAETPGLKFGFILACGRGINGQSNRLDAITQLYPGDQYVDVVGCNTYDWWGDKARNDAEWAHHIRPSGGVGIADMADFARQHGKGMAIPEWGPAATSVQGSGDNPFFIQKMYDWLMANKDVVVLENYFMEAASNVANSLVNPTQMPQSAALYQKLW